MGHRPCFYVLWPRFKNAASEPFFRSVVLLVLMMLSGRKLVVLYSCCLIKSWFIEKNGHCKVSVPCPTRTHCKVGVPRMCVMHVLTVLGLGRKNPYFILKNSFDFRYVYINFDSCYILSKLNINIKYDALK